ncbi:MAG TPA: SAM-dependent methyltransferase [Bacteroidales bacterium]|nr:SAM-dependent methyltransferase [Bacteroidales bacterium]
MLENALYLIPVTLGDQEPALVLPVKVFDVIGELEEFIVENERTARRFLRKSGYTRNFDTVKFHLLNKHTLPEELAPFLDSVKNGKAVGLLSEAGVPCIADPGAVVVQLCHQHSLRVIPLTGPSSLLLALMASGFNGQNFAFHGYLPIQKPELRQKLRELEASIYQRDQTQIFIETPYRNDKLIENILSHCQPQTRLCIATDITLDTEWISTRPVSWWRQHKPTLHKRPSVFLLYK